MWLRRLIESHVLTNLFFMMVLLMGTVVYLDLPREQDPNVNFNWVQITTLYPGASAEHDEKKITDVLEDAIEKIQIGDCEEDWEELYKNLREHSPDSLKLSFDCVNIDEKTDFALLENVEID